MRIIDKAEWADRDEKPAPRLSPEHLFCWLFFVATPAAFVLGMAAWMITTDARYIAAPFGTASLALCVMVLGIPGWRPVVVSLSMATLCALLTLSIAGVI